MGAIIQQAMFIPFEDEGKRMVFFGWIGAGILTRAVFGAVLILFAERVSRFLFRETENVITAGAINGSALFWVGLSILGFYFLLSYLPALVEVAVHWFRSEATDARAPDFDPGPYYSPVELIVMTVLSLFLIFRSKSVCDWVIRVSK